MIIFALWVLVVEPTFGAYEQFEDRTSHNECPGGDGVAELDQQIPPGEVVAQRWMNHHVLNVLTLPLLDSTSSTLPLDSLVPTAAPSLLPAELHMPYPPSARPLRL